MSEDFGQGSSRSWCSWEIEIQSVGASRTPSRLCVTWSTLLATSLLDIQSTYPRWQPPTATHTRSSDTSWEVPSASETSATLLSAPGTGLLDFLLCCSSLLSISSVYFGSALRLMWRFLLSDYGKVVVQAVIVAEILRIQMQGACPAAVGMGQVATLSRAQYLRGAPQDLPLLIHTSHTLWVRTTAPLSHFAFNSTAWKLTPILPFVSRHQSKFPVGSVGFGAPLSRPGLRGEPFVIIPLWQQPPLLASHLHHRPGALSTFLYQPAVSTHAPYISAAPAGLHFWSRWPFGLPLQPQHTSLQTPHTGRPTGQRWPLQHRDRPPQPAPSPSSTPTATQPHCLHSTERWHLLQSAGL